MRNYSMNHKTLSAVVLLSLLAASPVWAKGWIVHTTVTTGNTESTPYSKIEVNETVAGGATMAIANQGTTPFTVYMHDGGTIVAESPNGDVGDINNIKAKGIVNSAAGTGPTLTITDPTLTITGPTDLTVNAGNASSKGAYYDEAYGLYLEGNSNTSLETFHAAVTALGGTATAGEATDLTGSAYGLYSDHAGLTAADADLTVKAQGGTAGGAAVVNAASAHATGVKLYYGTADIKGALTLDAEATGGKYETSAKVAKTSASATGIYLDNGTMAVGGDIVGTISATGGTSNTATETDGSTVFGEAYGLAANSANTVSAANLNFTVTAHGGSSTDATDTSGDAGAEATGIKRILSTDSSAASLSSLTIANAAVLKANASGGSLAITGKVLNNETEAYGIGDFVWNGTMTTTLGSLDVTANATGGTAPASALVKANAYGLRYEVVDNGSDTLTVNGTSTITATAQAAEANAAGQNSLQAYGLYDNGGVMKLQDATISANAAGGTYSTIVGAVLTSGTGTLDAKALHLNAVAAGGTLQLSLPEQNVETDAYGLENAGANLNVGDVVLDKVSATGTMLAKGVTAKEITVKAIGLDNSSVTSASVGKVSGIVTATGATGTGVTGSSSIAEVNAHGIHDSSSKPLTVAGAALTVQATGVDAETNTATTASGLKMEGTSLTVTGPIEVNVTATGAKGSISETQASGIVVMNETGVTSLDLQDVSGTVQATNKGGTQRNIVGAAGIDFGEGGQGSSLTVNNVDLTVKADNSGASAATSMISANGLSASTGTLQVKGNAAIKVGVTPSGAANEIFLAHALSVANTDTVMNVGMEGGKTVQLEGDIGAYLGGTLNVTLDGAKSYLLGNVSTTYPISGLIDQEGTVNLTVTNGATWKPVYDNRYGSANTGIHTDTTDFNSKAQNYTFTDNRISTLALSNGGVVDLTWDNADNSYRAGVFRTLNIGTLTGDGGIFKVNTDLANNKADQITLGDSSTSTAVGIDVAYDPYLAASGLTVNSNITGKALVLTDNSKKLTRVSGVADSYNLYEYTPTITDNGDNTYSVTKLTITNVIPEPTPTPGKQTITTPSRPMRNARQERMAQHNLWVNGELNNMSKRLGDLRAMEPAEAGIWARYEHNNLDHGDNASLKYNMIQVGYDKDFAGSTGTTYRGAAMSYAKGTGDYEQADGDVKETTLSLYQTWVGKDGRYYDIILKGGKLMSDYDLHNTSNPANADYSTWGYSVSGELGKRFYHNNGIYVEPQVEFTLSKIKGADYTTSTGMQVNVDSQNTALARIGVAIGREIKNIGSYYFKASYYHDFGGGLRLTASDDTTNPFSYGEDSAKNWCIFTLGGTVKAGKNCDIYGEFSRFTGQLSNNLQYNVGARWKI